MSKGILLHGGQDEVIQGRAKAAGLPVVSGPPGALPFEKTLIVQAGTRVPWDMLPAAWHFLERWDAAVPLWRYGMTAAGVGTAEERAATEVVVRDLRVLLHSVELVFVRRNEAGQALVEAWRRECAPGGDKRLAFLRAVHLVKPRLCVLPISWLAEVQQQSLQHMGRSSRLPRSPNAGRPLVRVELEPGRFVKCHKGDEERVLAHYRRQMEER